MVNEEYEGMKRIAHLSPFDKSCPSVYRTREGDYVLIGSRVDPKDAGLTEAVGNGESVIKVPKDLLDTLLRVQKE